jgi:hypothetical protein
MGSKVTMLWDDWRGEKIERDVNQVIDVRDFIGTPGCALLLIAANTNLTVSELDRYLNHIMRVERSRNWIQKRRWVFQQPGTANATSPADVDGKGERARDVMRANSRLSLRDLVLLLKENGVIRSREWVRTHRCD